MSSTNGQKLFTPPRSRYTNHFTEDQDFPLCLICIGNNKQNSILECCQDNSHSAPNDKCPSCWHQNELKSLNERGECTACKCFFSICYSCKSRIGDETMGEYIKVFCHECFERDQISQSVNGIANIRIDDSADGSIEPTIDQDKFVQEMREFLTQMPLGQRAELIHRLIQDLELHREETDREIAISLQ